MKFDRYDKEGNPTRYQIAGEPGAQPQAAETDQAPIAVIVAHGMGQQVPFETLGMFVDGLQAQAGAPRTKVLGKTEFVNQSDGTRVRLSWLEAVLMLQEGKRAVHFYEIYWAPITQGVATLRDVTWFLVGAGLGRITPSRAKFSRWLFGRFRRLGTEWWTPSLLLVALAVVGSLVVLNGAIGAIVTSKVTGIAKSAKWMSSEALVHLMRTYALLLAVFVVFVLTLVLSKGISLAVRRVLRWISWLALVVWIDTDLAAVLTAGLMSDQWRWTASVVWVTAPTLVLTLVLSTWAIPLRLRKGFRWMSLFMFGLALFGTGWAAAITVGSMTGLWPRWSSGVVAIAAPADRYGFVILAVLVGVSWFIRRFLVQYIGDVAIYVESHSVDRFSRARQDIRDVAMKTARAVYETGKYSDIAWAGHSLGSVVAYDTLNQLILEKEDRSTITKLLLTFGSPLDKTAYLFGSQVADNAARELLAGSLQPLIQKPEWRPRWVNVHSKWDIVGGSLEFYDNPEDPAGARTRVKNLNDPDATTLLAAHVEHWSGTFIYKTFISELEQLI